VYKRQSKGIYYPIITIYAAQLSQVCNVDPVVFVRCLPAIFALIYVVFIYLLAKSILPNKAAVILTALAALAPIYGFYYIFTPNSLANLIFPMPLFLLFKSFGAGAWRWRALFILMAFLFPVLHPVPTIALAVILVTIPLAKVIFDKVVKSGHRIIDSSVTFTAVALAILLIWGGGWLSSFGVAQSVTKSLVAERYSIPAESAMTYEPATAEAPATAEEPPPVVRSQRASHLVRLISRINYAQFYGYSVVKQFFRVYGGSAALVILALIALIILWRRARRVIPNKWLVSFASTLVMLGLVTMALFFTGGITSPFRLMAYIIVVCIPVTGFILSEFIDWACCHTKWLAKIAACVTAIFLVGLFIHGAMTVYRSPYIVTQSFHTTQTKIQGMDWFLHKIDAATPMSGICIYPGRFADFLLTPEERRNSRSIPRQEKEDVPVPWHFGYDRHSILGQSYSEDVYLVLDQESRILYVDVFPEVAKFRYWPSDFRKLETDQSLDKLYSNSGLDVYYVHAAE